MSDDGIFDSKLGVTGYGPRTRADVWNVNQVNALYYSHTSTQGRQWNDNTGPQLTITYSFMGDTPGVGGVLGNTNPAGVASFDPEEYGPGSEADGFLMLNGDQREDIEAAIAAWEAVTNVDFVRNTTEPGKITLHTETNSTAGDIRFGMSSTGLSSPTESAHAAYPSTGDQASYGDVWLRRSEFELQAIDPGGFRFYAVLHEMGHGVYGLGHSFEAGLNGLNLDETSWDSNLWTVMSYTPGPAGTRPKTPMYLDILASRAINGAFEVFNTGNNVYQADGSSLMTIWDNGGNDAIVWTDSRAAYIDLTSGKLTGVDGGFAILEADQSVGWSGVRDSEGNGFDQNEWRLFIAPQSVIEDVTGDSGADFIRGNNVSNTLRGGDGFDTLLGEGGVDTLQGGLGVDTLNGGDGVDWADYSDLDGTVLTDPVTVDLVNNVARRFFDQDTLVSIENAMGSERGDTFIGNGVNNVFDGHAGNDAMIASLGDDIFRGNEDIDTVDYSGLSTDVTVDLLNQTATALIPHGDTPIVKNDYFLDVENAIGTAFGDVLYGSNLANVLTGLSGDDILAGNQGADEMRGGSGNDTYVVDNAGDQAIENANEGTADTVYASINFVLGPNLERLILQGAGANGTGNGLTNEIIGDQGNNVLDGSGGADIMRGEMGDDTYIVENAGDQVTENPTSGSGIALFFYGTDTVRTSLANYTLPANVENLAGTAATAQTLTGNAEANIFFYTTGLDTLHGQGGTDTADFSGFGSAVWVDLSFAGREGWTRDGVNVNTGAWREIARLTSLENVVGTARADFIRGDGNANTLSGGDGNDTLLGGGGNDVIDGGDGTDTVIFANAAASYGVSVNGSDILVTGAGEGTDTVRDTVELFQFSDLTITRANLIAVQTGPAFTETADTAVLPFANGGAFNALGGDDRLAYTGGLVTIDGGAGSDTVDFSDFGSAVWVDLTYPAPAREGWTRGSADLASGTWREIADLSNVENLIGTAFSDFLQGNGANNVLGYTGGLDILNGGGGTDTVDFSDFGSAVWVSLAYSGREAWTRGGPDLATGVWREIADLNSIEALIGTAFDDQLLGDGGANTLRGGAGNDTLTGGGGNDLLDGGDGTDTAVFANRADNYDIAINGNDILVIRAGESTDTDTVLDTVESFQFSNVTLTRAQVLSSAAAPIFSEDADTVTLPFRGTGTLNALGGDDLLACTGGRFTIDGGGGTDTVDFSGFGSAVWVSMGYDGQDIWTKDSTDLNSGTWRAIGDLGGVENLIDTAFSDFLQGDAANNAFGYTGGLDTYDGRDGFDTADFSRFGSAVWVDLLFAGREAWTRDRGDLTSGAWRELADLANIENVVGTAGADAMYGNASNNRFEGGAGADKFGFKSGFGNDTIADFNPGGALDDVLEFALGSSYDAVQKVLDAATQVNANVEFDFGTAGHLTLLNVAKANLAANDFLFV